MVDDAESGAIDGERTRTDVVDDDDVNVYTREEAETREETEDVAQEEEEKEEEEISDRTEVALNLLTKIPKRLKSQQKWMKLFSGLLICVTLLFAVVAILLLFRLPTQTADRPTEESVVVTTALGKSLLAKLTNMTEQIMKNTKYLPNISAYLVGLMERQLTVAESVAKKEVNGVKSETPITIESVATTLPRQSSPSESWAPSPKDDNNKDNNDNNKNNNNNDEDDDEINKNDNNDDVKIPTSGTLIDIRNTLYKIWSRMSSHDYRYANYSCPNWNSGQYQYIGPYGYFSTCYFVQENV